MVISAVVDGRLFFRFDRRREAAAFPDDDGLSGRSRGERDGGGLWLSRLPTVSRVSSGTMQVSSADDTQCGQRRPILKLRRRTQIARGTSPPEVGACGTWRTSPIHHRPDLSARSYYCASPSALPSRNPDSSSHLPFSQPNSAFYPHHNLHLKTQSLLTLSFAL